MKNKYFILIICLLSVVCFLASCANDSNLPEMTYDYPDSAVSMTFGGEKYFFIGSKPNNIERDKKVAKVKTDKGLPNSYVYTIKGYDEKDFLIVEERTIGLVLDVYLHEGVTSIPWELLDGNVMVSGDEHIEFNGFKYYYYFSKTPADFLIDKELSMIKKDGNSIHVYKIADQPETEWIAVKDDSFYKEGYLLYWIRGTSLPREFAELWRIYGR